MGALPPFTTDSATSQQAGLWVVSILVPIYSVLILAVRFALRRTFKKSDIVICVGYVAAFISWILMWVALQKGIGKATNTISPDDYTAAANLTYGNIAGALLAIGFATASQCFFVQELTEAPRQQIICYTSAATCLVLTLATLLTVLAGCSPSKYLNHSAGLQDACSGQDSRWIAAAVMLCLVSVIPTVLPPILFNDLAVPLSRKMNIYIAFSGAVLNVPIIGVLAHYFRVWNSSGADGLYSVTFLEVLQTLVLWTLVSTTLPCTRQVALRFTTSRTLLVEEGKTQSMSANGSRNGGRGMLNTVKSMKSLKNGQQSQNASRISFERPKLRDDVQQHTVTSVSAGPANAADESASVVSFGSERQFIRKTVGLTVEAS